MLDLAGRLRGRMDSEDQLKDGAAVTAMLRQWQELVPHDRMAHLVKDTWRGLRRALQTRLSEHSVLFGHWVFLRILWEQDGITQTHLSEKACLMLPTTHSALATMERLGYVRLERRASDRRRVYVHLTAKGRAMREPLAALAVEVNEVALRGIPARQIAATRRTMRTMIENLACDEFELMKTERRMPSTRNLASAERKQPRKPEALRKSGSS